MPNTDGGNWYTPAKRVYDEVWAQWDGQCGGGIFWVSYLPPHCSEI